MNNDDEVDGTAAALKLALVRIGDDAPNTKRVIEAILRQTVAGEDGQRPFTDEIDECVFG